MTDEPSEEDKEARRLFDQFDTDRNGLVDQAEFRSILQALGEDPSDEVLSLEFALVDANSDGLVDYAEFVEWWRDYD